MATFAQRNNRFLFNLSHFHRGFNGFPYPTTLVHYGQANGLLRREHRHAKQCLPLEEGAQAKIVAVLTDWRVLSNVYFIGRILMTQLDHSEWGWLQVPSRYESVSVFIHTMHANRTTLFSFTCILTYSGLVHAFTRMALLDHGGGQDVFLKTSCCWYYDFVLPLDGFTVKHQHRRSRSLCPMAERERLLRMERKYSKWFTLLIFLFPTRFNIAKLVEYARLNRFDLMPKLTVEQKLNALLVYSMGELVHFVLVTGAATIFAINVVFLVCQLFLTASESDETGPLWQHLQWKTLLAFDIALAMLVFGVNTGSTLHYTFMTTMIHYLGWINQSRFNGALITLSHQRLRLTCPKPRSANLRLVLYTINVIHNFRVELNRSIQSLLELNRSVISSLLTSLVFVIFPSNVLGLSLFLLSKHIEYLDLIQMIFVLYQISVFLVTFAMLSMITDNIHRTRRAYIPIQWQLPCRMGPSKNGLTRDKLSLMLLHETVNNSKRVVFQIGNFIRVDKRFVFDVVFLYAGYMLTLIKLIRLGEQRWSL